MIFKNNYFSECGTALGRLLGVQVNGRGVKAGQIMLMSIYTKCTKVSRQDRQRHAGMKTGLSGTDNGLLV